MAVYQPKYRAKDGTLKASKVFWMDFIFRGQAVREPTGVTTLARARKVEANRRRGLEENLAGIRRQPMPKLFKGAAKEYLETKSTVIAASSLGIEKANLKHLSPVFGRQLLTDIEAADIRAYQKRRLDAGASPRTINLEIGTLRAILRKNGLWNRLQPEVKLFSAQSDVGQALTPLQERALLQACHASRSRSLHTFVLLALETGARFGVIRTLQWGNVNFQNRSITFGKDKTAAGTGRTIPMNDRAIVELRRWANQFATRQPEHYVFPQERYGGKGSVNSFGFNGAVPYDIDPTIPIGDPKTAWETAKRKAGELLAGGGAPPLSCRFHDLRHTAVSRMLNARTPLAQVAKVVGWSPSTMVQMSARYGHFSLDDLRGAVASISSQQL